MENIFNNKYYTLLYEKKGFDVVKKFFQEFKDFAMRGNVMDMAVGVVIGGAFKGIVDSLVNDLLNPLLGIFGNQDLSAYDIVLFGTSFHVGSFFTSVINFLIMSFVIFLLVKAINHLRALRSHKEEPESPSPTTKVCPYCKSEIHLNATRCPHCTSEQP